MATFCCCAVGLIVDYIAAENRPAAATTQTPTSGLVQNCAVHVAITIALATTPTPTSRSCCAADVASATNRIATATTQPPTNDVVQRPSFSLTK